MNRNSQNFPKAFAGTLLGMLVLGFLGDAIGRNPAMVLTQSVAIFAVLVAAFLTWGPLVYPVFAFARLLLGFAVGGMYPLGAALSAEAESKNDDVELLDHVDDHGYSSAYDLRFIIYLSWFTITGAFF